MYRLVTLNNTGLGLLPNKCFGKVNADYAFTVLKEDPGSYLLEMPPNCGGHTNDSAVPAYWVSKSYCNPGYKIGQRWQYKTLLVAEFTENRLGSSAIVVQSMDSSFTVGATVSTVSAETFPDYWMYLRGQDKPV